MNDTDHSVNSLLLVTESNSLSEPFLFQILRHYTLNGSRVLYIAPEPISTLPPTFQETEVLTDPEITSLISFHYLPGRSELLKYLSSIQLVHKPPTTIIVQNMEVYCNSGAGLVSATILNAASICSMRSTSTCNLIVSFQSPSPPFVVLNFFHNVWCVHQDQDKSILVRNLNPKPKIPACFHFSMSRDCSRVLIDKVLLRL